MDSVLPVIIAIAGHVDHGKTALVEALTGCNTDRLPQEKERGLSIDIGFAPCRLSTSRCVGIVDLPGHEDFIKNMVAGAAAANLLILVVAADESVMPQTREHLHIVAQLTSARVILVITKIDLVHEQDMEPVAAAAEGLVAELGLELVGTYYTSVKTFAGLQQLRSGLEQAVSGLERRDDKRVLRVFVERTFLAKGHGLIITGIPCSGKVCLHDYLRLNGGGVRIRGIESYGSKLEKAEYGRCLALNIDYLDAVCSTREITRGDVLHAGEYKTSAEYIVRLQNISDDYCYPRVTRCRAYVGTLSCNASFKLFRKSSLEPGGVGFGHLKLERESVLAAGDRFLLRIASPFGNIGGGIILSSDGGYRLSSKDSYRSVLFQAAAEAVENTDYTLAELLAGRQIMVSRQDIGVLGHLAPESIQPELERLVAQTELRMVADNCWAVTQKLEILAASFAQKLRFYHQQNPYRLGMDYEYAATILGVPVRGVERMLRYLQEYIAIEKGSGFVAASGFEPALQGKELSMYQVASQSLLTEPLHWLPLGELRDSCGVSAKAGQAVVGILVATGVGVVIGGKYLVSSVHVAELKALLLREFAGIELVDIASWRRVCGLSRNHAVAILEYFDKLGLTIRLENGRKIIDNKS